MLYMYIYIYICIHNIMWFHDGPGALDHRTTVGGDGGGQGLTGQSPHRHPREA